MAVELDVLKLHMFGSNDSFQGTEPYHLFVMLSL